MEHGSFKHPDELFRGTDFWMLNGNLSEEEIVHQLHEMKDKGVYSFIARTYLGLKSDYPGPNFKSKMRVIVDTARELGLKIFVQAGYMPEAVLGLPEAHALRYIYPVKAGEEDGRRVLCRHGEWTFVEHNSVTFLDMFDPDAMEHYLKVSYEEMWAEFAEEYGKTVLSVWVDEPSYNSQYLPWTPRLEGLFSERFGYDLAEKVWMLYFDAEESATVRYHYRVLMRDLLEENYFKKVSDWCHAHGLLFSGHLMMEDTIRSQIMRAQACMPYYRYFDIPGMDVLRADMSWVDDPIHSLEPYVKKHVFYNTVMQCVSGANQAGKKHILAEMYGVGGENFTFRNMTSMFDSFAAAGINHRSVHGIFYTLHGRGKRAYPPHISYYQPFWAKYKNVTDYCARVSAFITDGYPAADVAVIHPLETGYMMYHAPIGKQLAGGKEIERLDRELLDLLRGLRSEHCSAEFADLASLRDMGRVDSGRLYVGQMSYRTVILPKLHVVTAQLVTLLERFAAEGGKVVIWGEAPTMLDGVYDATLAPRLEAIAERTESLSSVLAAVSDKDYAIEGLGVEQLFVNHRICEGGEKFFIHNHDYAHEARFTLSTKRLGTLYGYDAYSGEIAEHPSRICDGMLTADITVQAGGSVLLSVEPPRADVEATVALPAVETIIPIDGEWQVERHQENVLFLEYCRLRKEDGEFSQPLPILAVQRLLTQQEYRGDITLRFEFETDAALDGLSLALEDPREQQILLDGVAVDGAPTGYYWEKTFEKIALGSLSRGRHTIEIRREFFPLSKVTNALTQLFETRHGVELEPMYLLGDFDVRGHRAISQNGCMVFERDFVLTALRKPLVTRGELTAVGMPFYVGEVTLSREVTAPRDIDVSQAKLRVGVMNAGCGEVFVNGVSVGDINRAPADLSVGGVLREGGNLVEIKLYSTLYNVIGPFHRPQGNVGNTFGGGYQNPDAAWLSVNTELPDWEKRLSDSYPNWTDQYNVVPFGICGVSLVV